MTRTFSFQIPIKPKAKARPRFSKGFTYTDKQTKDYESSVCAVVRKKWNELKMTKPLDGPVELFASFYFARPNRLNPDNFKRKKISKEAIPHDKKPDLDNVLKSLMDGINKSGIWSDDARVYHSDVSKFYVEHGTLPRIEVVLIERGAL